jgi:hypothetical protein
VRENAKTYVHNESQAAQDLQQLADCILNSITVEARNLVTLCEEDITKTFLKALHYIFWQE